MLELSSRNTSDSIVTSQPMFSADTVSYSDIVYYTNE